MLMLFWQTTNICVLKKSVEWFGQFKQQVWLFLFSFLEQRKAITDAQKQLKMLAVFFSSPLLPSMEMLMPSPNCRGKR